MTGPQQHRRDPQPLGRSAETAAAALGALLLLLAVAALTGQAAASALFGGGWVWPHGTDTTRHVLGGLLAGHPGRGLPPGPASRLPAPAAVYAGVAAAELTLIGLSGWAAVLVAGYRRPGDARRGMASRADTRQALGRRRLKFARTVIRPDLHGPTRTRPTGRPAAGRRFDPADAGWHVGRSHSPRGVDLWCRYDATTGVYGEQGSGKTLDLLAPALLAHRGAALATLTKVEDLLLTAGRRSRPQHAGGPARPVAVLDPFGAAPGLPLLVWDPVAGCVDPQVAERRAKAFAAGTVTGAVTGGRADNAARFYAAETAKVLQGFLHAAALTGRTLEHVLECVANPVAAEQPAEILGQHRHAARFWDGLLAGALHGSPDTVGNTVTTVQQAMSLFFQPDIRARCLPAAGRPATDLPQLIAAAGTVYLLGREDPYASAAPLMTAVAEHVLDTALHLANSTPYGRMTPPFLACLDELSSTTPLPTLRVRMANERALGLSFIYAAQTWKQMVVAYGEDEARSVFGLTNNLVIFGGGKDVHFYTEISQLIDDVRISRQTINDGPGGIGTSQSGEDVPVLRPGDIRRIRDRHALLVAGNSPPVIARLSRCLDGTAGRQLKAELDAARTRLNTGRKASLSAAERTTAALAYARQHQLTPNPPPEPAPAPQRPSSERPAR